MNSFSLYFAVNLLRLYQSISALINRTFPFPYAPSPSFTVTIPTTSRQRPGTIKLLFYTPSTYQRPHRSVGESKTLGTYPLIINFHGGGYTIGSAADDARLAAQVTKKLAVVFVSVDYGLAPKYPYPVAVGDCVDAVKWLWAHADEYKLSASKTMIMGFSAGGTLAHATTLRINAAVLNHQTYGSGHEGSLSFRPLASLASASPPSGKIIGLLTNYPGLDWTQTRKARTSSNNYLTPANPGAIPPFFFELFDTSYLGTPDRRPVMSHPDLSPACVSTDFLQSCFPSLIAIYSCQYDQLLSENEAWRRRLKEEGKVVGGYMVEGEAHGWDGTPRRNQKERLKKRDRLHEDMIKEMESMIEMASKE